MSLLLSGAKTATIAGTEMQVVEIYEDEAYTIPFQFTDSTGSPIDCTGWTLGMNAKWYNCIVTYPGGDLINPVTTTVIVSELELLSPQPSQPTDLDSAFTDDSTGEGYIYIPSDIKGGQTLLVDDVESLLAITTLTITRTDPASSQPNITREPIGFIIRYQ